MAKGINHSCAHVWRAIARAGGWWSVQRVTAAWAGVLSLPEIEEHLATLTRCGFLVSMVMRREGTVYAYTHACRPLPGETILPMTSAPTEPTANPVGDQAQAEADNVAQPDRINRMAGNHFPTVPVARQGAMDYARIPSLHMGKRRDFRSEAAR